MRLNYSIERIYRKIRADRALISQLCIVFTFCLNKWCFHYVRMQCSVSQFMNKITFTQDLVAVFFLVRCCCSVSFVIDHFFFHSLTKNQCNTLNFFVWNEPKKNNSAFHWSNHDQLSIIGIEFLLRFFWRRPFKLLIGTIRTAFWHKYFSNKLSE